MKLHVAGGVRGERFALINSSAGPNITWGGIETLGNWYVRSANSAGKVVLQDTGGKVTIGTTTPHSIGSTLTVDGGSQAALYASSSSPEYAITGFTDHASGVGVGGVALDDGTGVVGFSPYGDGVVGFSFSPSRYAIFGNGDLGASGVKTFVQPHPTDASRQVRFVCLEGNEAGTYFRGKTRLIGGTAVIAVPDDFRMVTESEGLSVHLTPGGPGSVWFESYDLDQVVIRGTADIEVHYTVNGVRRGYAEFETVVENRAYRPDVRGEAFGRQYPQEIRDILVANGILNPDYTPNEATAARLGWTLREPTTADPNDGL